MSSVSASQNPPRRVRVEQIMGTVIGLDLREPWVPADAVAAFFAWLLTVDSRFSTYRADSQVSRLRRGEISFQETDDDFREVLALCDEVQVVSHGAFDVWRFSEEGLDPSGLVKGWSVDRGVEILRRAGARNFCVNAGGDVMAAGEPTDGQAWRVGVRHPHVGDRVAKVVAVRDLAVATSGAYERGAHIANPTAPASPADLLSLTVVGPGLTLTDAYATAAFAMGAAGISWVASQPGYGVCAVTQRGRTVWDDTFGALIAG